MVTIGTLNGGNITITTGGSGGGETPVPVGREITRAWWSDDESDYSDLSSDNGTFDSSCWQDNTSCIKIEFGNDVRIIGDWLFEGTDLESVVFGNNIQSIGDGAFFGTPISEITLPNSVTQIGGSAFNSCGMLTNVTLPDSVTSIGIDAFIGCEALTSVTIVATGNPNANAANVKEMLINAASVNENITWNMPS